MLHDVTWSNASLIALRFLLFPLEPSISFYLCVRFTRHDVPPSPDPGSYPPSNFPITPPPVRSLHFLSCQPSSTPPVPRCHERKGRNANVRGTSANQHHSLRIPREPRPDPEFPRKKKKTNMALFFPKASVMKLEQSWNDQMVLRDCNISREI